MMDFDSGINCPRCGEMTKFSMAGAFCITRGCGWKENKPSRRMMMKDKMRCYRVEWFGTDNIMRQGWATTDSISKIEDKIKSLRGRISQIVVLGDAIDMSTDKNKEGE